MIKYSNRFYQIYLIGLLIEWLAKTELCMCPQVELSMLFGTLETALQVYFAFALPYIAIQKMSLLFWTNLNFPCIPTGRRDYMRC